MNKFISIAALLVTTALSGCSVFDVYAVGDSDDSSRAAAVANRAPNGANLAYLGDVYETGSASDFTNNFNDVWGRFKANAYPTPGNHDWANHATGYDPYWGSRAPQTGGGHWYTRVEEGWTFISVNTEESIAPGSAQFNYVKFILNSRAGTCAVVFTHEPRYGVGHADRPDIQPLWDEMENHAILYVSGHDHLQSESNVVQGITQLVSGAGGRSLYGDNGLPHPNIAWYQNDDDGILKGSFQPGSVSWQFIDKDGDVRRSGSRTCTPRNA